LNRGDLEEAAAVIAQGGIVAYPTESCYGLGCDPRLAPSVRRLLGIKRRSIDKGVILVGADWSQLSVYVDCSHREAIARAQESWPGPYTWLLPGEGRTPYWIRGDHPKVAVRVTSHPGAAALCRHARRALVSTSANRQGFPPASTFKEVSRTLGDEVDYILRGRVGQLSAPTTITDALSGDLIRQGGEQ